MSSGECLYERDLDDEHKLWVYRMLYNDRLVLGRKDNDQTYEQGFCFHQDGSAIEAAKSWSGVGDPPGAWIKEVGTNRYGPGAMKWERADA